MRNPFLLTSNTIGQCYITLTIILFCFSRQTSPLFSVLGRREEIHFIVFVTYFSTMSDRSLTVCHIIFWVISFAKLLHFQHWYIIILWFYCIIHLLKQLIITVSHFCQHISSCWSWPHFVTSFKFSVFVADHDICAAKDGLPLICCQLFISIRSFAVFSVTCVEEGILRLHQGIGSEALRRSILETLARSSAFSAAQSLQFWTVFMQFSFIHFESITH